MRKIIVLLFMTAFLVSAVNVCSQEPPPTPREKSQKWQSDTTKTDKNGNTHQNCTQKEPLLIKALKDSEVGNKNANTQGQDIDQKSSTEHAIDIVRPLISAIATLAIAVFTVFLVLYNKKMWETTNKVADAAKNSADSYKASEGAHLFIDYIKWKKWEPTFTLSEYNKSVASINIVNVGRTPAILVDIGAAVNIKKINYPTKEEVGRVNTINFPKGVIIKTLGIEPISCQERIGPSVISEDDFSQSIIICYGFVRYEDIFGNGHETGFCYEFKPRQADDSFRISSNKELNYYT